MNNIYLAGKINKNGWRHELLPGLRDCNISDEQKETIRFPIWEKAILNYYNYAGPYFIGDDHGCAHGANSHGCDPLVCNSGPEGYSEQHYNDRHLEVFGACIEAINKTDVMIAYIDSIDAYGTFAEIGYAYMRIPVISFIDKTLWDSWNGNEYESPIWFVLRMTPQYRITTNPTVDILNQLKSWMPVPKVNHAEYINTQEWRIKADAAKERAGHRCQLCNSNGPLHAHHRTYERLGNEVDGDIIVLCATCHAKFHNKLPKPKTHINPEPIQDTLSRLQANYILKHGVRNV